MGKTTLYHPVSLHVIRGAAEYCGFQFGKLKQLWGNPEKRTARYEATIQQVPALFVNQSTMVIQNELQKCFMDDIRVHWVHHTRSGVLGCHIQTCAVERDEL
jgi:hypothetical protein